MVHNQRRLQNQIKNTLDAPPYSFLISCLFVLISAEHHASLRGVELRPVLARRHHRRSVLPPRPSGLVARREPADVADQGHSTQELEGNKINMPPLIPGLGSINFDAIRDGMEWITARMDFGFYDAISIVSPLASTRPESARRALAHRPNKSHAAQIGRKLLQYFFTVSTSVLLNIKHVC